MKPTVLLDCDGILTNYAAQTVKLVNELYGTELVEADITDWEASSYLPKNARRDAYWAHVRAPGFVQRMEPYPEAQAAVRELKRIAEVVVVTSYLKRATTWTYERDWWLAEHFAIPPENVIHTRAKQHVVGDVFVDDAIKNIVPWAQRNPDRTALLWDKPYNQQLHRKPLNVHVIDRWQDVHNAVANFT